MTGTFFLRRLLELLSLRFSWILVATPPTTSVVVVVVVVVVGVVVAVVVYLYSASRSASNALIVP